MKDVLHSSLSGYECGRVFPPGVGPGSPSRNATNWLSARVSRSVAAAVWLAEDGVPRCLPLPCSNLVPFGRWRHARGREHCRGELVSARSVGTLQIRRERRAVRSSTSQGSAEPLCARIKGANREVSEGKADLRPWYVFFLRRPARSGERVNLVAPALPAQGLHHHGPRYFNFPYLCMMYGLKKLGLIDQN